MDNKLMLRLLEILKSMQSQPLKTELSHTIKMLDKMVTRYRTKGMLIPALEMEASVTKLIEGMEYLNNGKELQ